MVPQNFHLCDVSGLLIRLPKFLLIPLSWIMTLFESQDLGLIPLSWIITIFESQDFVLLSLSWIMTLFEFQDFVLIPVIWTALSSFCAKKL